MAGGITSSLLPISRLMASQSLPTATAVRVCEEEEGKSGPTVPLTRELGATGEVEEAEELKSEMGEPPVLRPHEQVRKNTKLLKAINWTNDQYELCVEKRAEQHSRALFVVFMLGEESSGKKFSCVISDKQQESLRLHEGAPLALCGMERLFQFMEDAYGPDKPEFSLTLPEFLESTVSSVSLVVSYNNGLSSWSAVQFQVQVDLALFHNPSEVELARMVVEKRVGALEDRVAGEVAALRQQLAAANEKTNRLLQEQVSSLRQQLAAANEKTNTLQEEVSSLRQFVLDFHQGFGMFELYELYQGNEARHEGTTNCNNTQDGCNYDGICRIRCQQLQSLKKLKLFSSNR
uniref:Uncharacterized protein n=1 Tax=Heterosigma akashiwo TaxID=2829 RepID=A0A6V1TG12_HETAK